MALAIHFDGLIQSGVVANYAELARLGNVTRARITQIMNLLMLAPSLQEELLILPRVEKGRDEVLLRDLQRVAAVKEAKRGSVTGHFAASCDSCESTSSLTYTPHHDLSFLIASGEQFPIGGECK